MHSLACICASIKGRSPPDRVWDSNPVSQHLHALWYDVLFGLSSSTVLLLLITSLTRSQCRAGSCAPPRRWVGWRGRAQKGG